MTVDGKSPESLSLQRWSQRKLAATREKNASAALANPAATPISVAAPAPVDVAQPAAATASATTLPSVESLTIESDFAPFFQPRVGETLKRQALKQLFRDPHFNVMDGLDVYVGDYSKSDPISADIVKQMVQGRYIFDPPATRINAQGHVEDVPPEEIAPGAPADPVPAGEPVLPSAQDAASTPAAVQPSPQQTESASAPPRDPESREPPTR